MLAWLAARARGSSFVLRVEDLDAARVVPGAEEELLEDLAWLGLDWDEGPDRGGPAGPYRQSERRARYDAAIAALVAAVRFAGDGQRVTFTDEVHGAVDPLGPDGVDDFVLRRADGVAAYQLAVVVDDAAMGIEEVVRGDDLLPSTPRQIALHRALQLAPPRFAHVPLLLDEGGERLAKRTRPASLASLRAGGAPPEQVVGRLAASAGIWPADRPARARDVLDAVAAGALWPSLDRRPAVWRG